MELDLAKSVKQESDDDCQNNENKPIRLSAGKPKIGRRKPNRPERPRRLNISSLHPEWLPPWSIRARVVSKSRIIEPNFEREKTFFNVDLMDGSGTIRATAFKENLLPAKFKKYYDMFEIDKVYSLSKLDVQKVKADTAEKSPIRNGFELMFNDSTKIVCPVQPPKVKYNFVAIYNVLRLKTGVFVDIIGTCKYAGEALLNMEKGVLEMTRNIQLKDTTGTLITVHLRGPEAEKFDGSGRVVAIKDGYVTSFDGENRIMADCYRLDPDIFETWMLRHVEASGRNEI